LVTSVFVKSVPLKSADQYHEREEKSNEPVKGVISPEVLSAEVVVTIELPSPGKLEKR
jgi:hypothetical protein